jgi:flagellum-specific peptidoglycan hydrolase FlgJ
MFVLKAKPMLPKDFVKAFYPFAKQTEQKTGISAIAILAQAALESGWGEKAPGNMFFGIKDTDGLNGNEQLLTTTEYSTKPNLKFPQIIAIVPVTRRGIPMFKYTVKDYFRKYATPEESFTEHGNFFLKNPRYQKALAVKNDPYRFVEEIATAGYATGPAYADLLKLLIKSIEKHLPK